MHAGLLSAPPASPSSRRNAAAGDDTAVPAGNPRRSITIATVTIVYIMNEKIAPPSPADDDRETVLRMTTETKVFLWVTLGLAGVGLG
ncbi:hypothetical protein ABE10_02400, partial [Bacillus toyonensis]|nr:hypothetical protein [Bacillus toyonensis]